MSSFKTAAREQREVREAAVFLSMVWTVNSGNLVEAEDEILGAEVSVMSLKAPQIVIAWLLSGTLACIGFLAVPAQAALYRIDLKDQNQRILTSQTVDTAKPLDKAIQHVAGGFAFEVKDQASSCGVFLQPSKTDRGTPKASVLVSIIENGTRPVAKSVVQNSGVLTKDTVLPEDQDVLPQAEGTKTVSVQAPLLKRSCSVTVL